MGKENTKLKRGGKRPFSEVKPKGKNVMKTHNNTTMISITIGLLTGSVLAGLMINPNWFILSLILSLCLGILCTTHGEEKIQQRSKNTFKS